MRLLGAQQTVAAFGLCGIQVEVDSRVSSNSGNTAPLRLGGPAWACMGMRDAYDMLGGWMLPFVLLSCSVLCVPLCPASPPTTVHVHVALQAATGCK